jgi:hypothetical protein
MNHSPMMTRAEAANWCRVSIAAFDAHVRPHLPSKSIGRRVLFHRSDLEAWSLAEAAPVAKGAPSLRPQVRAGASPLLQQLLASPEAKAVRDSMARYAERRAIREAKANQKELSNA